MAKEDKKVTRRERKKAEAEAKAKKTRLIDAKQQKKEDELTEHRRKVAAGEDTSVKPITPQIDPSNAKPEAIPTPEQKQANAEATDAAVVNAKTKVSPLEPDTLSGGLRKKTTTTGSPRLDNLSEVFSNTDSTYNASNISDAFLEAPEKLSRNDLFPGLSQPIHVGNTGGSEIGNIPIFVGGGDIFPVEIINARVRAMAKGSAKTRAENKKLEQAFEYLDTADQFEGALNTELIDLTEEFRRKYRNNWRSASKDPEFRKRYADLKAKAGGLTALSTKAEEVLKAAKNGNFYVSKEAREAAMSTAQGINDFKETSAEDVLKNQEVLNTWESSIAGATRIASKVGTEFKTEFKELTPLEQTEALGIISTMKVGDYKGLARITTLMPSLDHAKLLAETDFDGGHLGTGQIKKDDYVKLVISMLNTKEEMTMSNVVSKAKQDQLDEELKLKKRNAFLRSEELKQRKAEVTERELAKQEAKEIKEAATRASNALPLSLNNTEELTDEDPLIKGGNDVVKASTKSWEVKNAKGDWETIILANGIEGIPLVSNDESKVGVRTSFNGSAEEGTTRFKAVVKRVISIDVAKLGFPTGDVVTTKGSLGTGFSNKANPFSDAQIRNEDTGKVSPKWAANFQRELRIVVADETGKEWAIDYDPRIVPNELQGVDANVLKRSTPQAAKVQSKEGDTKTLPSGLKATFTNGNWKISK